MVTLMFSGYAVGGMLAALLGKGLIESLRLAVGVLRRRLCRWC